VASRVVPCIKSFNMGSHKNMLVTCLVLLMATGGRAQSSNSNVLGTFVASTPCTAPSKPLPGIAANAECELMKWKLVLLGNNAANPSGFTLHCTYGLPKQGTTGFMPGSKEVMMEGVCAVTKGTATNPNATVYRLTDNKTGKSISLFKLGDNALHLLDEGMHLMIGTAAWSYTLNRIDNQ